jgi:phi13 family phage major tail protein
MAGVQVGLRDLHYIKLKTDNDAGVEYDYGLSGTDKPVNIAGAINARISPSSNTATLYADDGPDEVATALGEIAVEIVAKDLSLDVQADLLGHTVTSGVMYRSADDVAPYVAIGFKSLKSNGKYRYVWLYKGKFDLPEQEYKTKEDTPEFQTPTITGTFVKRIYDGAWQAIVDEDDLDSESPEIDLDTWFDEVYEASDET